MRRLRRLWKEWFPGTLPQKKRGIQGFGRPARIGRQKRTPPLSLSVSERHFFHVVTAPVFCPMNGRGGCGSSGERSAREGEGEREREKGFHFILPRFRRNTFLSLSEARPLLVAEPRSRRDKDDDDRAHRRARVPSPGPDVGGRRGSAEERCGQ